MLDQLPINFSRITLFILLVILIPEIVFAQSLESKLSQKADYVPMANSTREQLIDLAQHYKIPMGIEWIDDDADKPKPSTLNAQPTVMAMLQSILKGAPGYTAHIKNGVVGISNPSFADNPHNFLNLKLAEYNISNDNVFGATAALRHQIRKTLHPERYARGSNGGYGYGVPRDDNFDLNNISLSGKNLTVRDVLNMIVGTNGNALWIVDLIPSRMMKNEPFFAQSAQTDFNWQIIPLGRF
jgi:hypothetical protein